MKGFDLLYEVEDANTERVKPKSQAIKPVDPPRQTWKSKAH